MKLIILSLVSFFLFSCIRSTLDKDTTNINYIKPSSDEDENSNYSNIVDTVEYIPLETSENSIFGTVDKLRFYDNRFFILSNKILFVFNAESGDFLFKINGVNRHAEGIFYQVANFSIDLQNKKIITSGGSDKKLNIYDWDGNYLSSRQTTFSTHQIVATNNGINIYLFNRGTNKHFRKDFNLVFLNHDMEVASYGLPIDSNVKRFGFRSKINFFKQYNDDVFFIQPFSNFIYKVKHDRIEPSYEVDFDKMFLPTDFFKDRKMSGNDDKKWLKKLRTCSYVYNINSFYQTEHYSFFDFYQDNIKCGVYISNNNKKIYSLMGLKNYYDFVPWSAPVHASKDHFFCLVEPYALFDIFNISEDTRAKVEEDKRFDTYMNLVSHLNEMSNPVIAKVKLKMFE